MFSCLFPAPDVWAKKKSDEDFNALFELVLGVRRGDETLTNSLLGFQKGFDNYYLPMKGLADILGLYIELDLEGGQASGWFLGADNTYNVDVTGGTYTIRGELVDLGPDDAFVRDLGAGFGDVYVRMDVLEKIWPLEMEMDFTYLQLKLNIMRKLPYELKRDRMARQDRFLNRGDDDIDTTGYNFVENPYEMISPPAIDASTLMRWSQDDGDWENRTNIHGTNDLLGFSADYNLNFERRDGHFEPPKDLRMTLTRRAWDHQEPMFAGIREVRLGDVSARTPDLVSTAESGRGISVSSRSLRRAGSFDEIIVEGFATPGWEVELYRSGELLDFGTVSDDGVYRFVNVPLFGGRNEIRIMLYGPSGQVEERVETHNVGARLLSPGEVEYNAAIVDVSDNLISLRKDDDTRRRYSPLYNEDDGYAYNASARVGVNRWMSLFATGSRSIARQGKQKYVTAGTDLALGPVSANIEGYQELGGGHAIDARFLTNMKGWRVRLRGAVMNDFESERVGYDDSARVLDLQGSVSNRFGTDIGRLGVSASANHEKYEDETTYTRYELNTDLSQSRRSYGNRLDLTKRDSKLESITGQANANFRIDKKTDLRSYLNYKVHPHFELSSVSTDLDYRHSDKLSAGLDFRRNITTAQNSVGANVNYDFGLFLASLATRWQQDSGLDVSLRASTSIAPYGEDGDYIMRSKGMRQSGALNADVFLDKNLNYIFDGNDEPLSDAVLLYGRKESEPANENGFVGEVMGATGEYQYVTLQENSTGNPFHAAAYPGLAVQLRPGTAQSVEFPVVMTGVIDGTAYFKDGAPVPGLKLQLVDAYGEVAKETLTSFDGFYTFELVRPGNYIIRSDPATNVNVPTRMVTVSSDALFVYGVNVHLLEKGGLPSSAVTVDAGMAQQNRAGIMNTLVRLQSALRGAVSGS
ncbi:MAG: carboxypeptidase regulatory-like domain-containing protein [Rhodospirillales bacterium]|nr:carboxypeptidase regulatory-like domain-containing protein [Rhodospirillales bacterium]